MSAETAGDVALECGWGRLVFGQTFSDWDSLACLLRSEELGQRDVCLYHPEPHVLVSRSPQELFVDPSHTYRRELADDAGEWMSEPAPGVVVRPLAGRADADAVNGLYAQAGMVTAPPEVMERNQESLTFSYLVAEDLSTGALLGTATGIDHVAAFGDPEGGSSLWCLAVDQRCSRPGVGAALVS
ncbi:MAG: N-acetylglutaminylglutamine synthetase, partial [Actinomycetota bacterium]|nr:N-acetylglutaminylglutamine synthetase [Actinomycetota bacterium]